MIVAHCRNCGLPMDESDECHSGLCHWCACERSLRDTETPTIEIDLRPFAPSTNSPRPVPSRRRNPSLSVQPYTFDFGDLPPIVFDATHRSAVLTKSPDRPFKGRRPVFEVTRSAGATAIVAMHELWVGDRRQIMFGEVPIAAFSPHAFDAELQLDACPPGRYITIGLRVIGELAEGETITVKVRIEGETIS